MVWYRPWTWDYLSPDSCSLQGRDIYWVLTIRLRGQEWGKSPIIMKGIQKLSPRCKGEVLYNEEPGYRCVEDVRWMCRGRWVAGVRVCVGVNWACMCEGGMHGLGGYVWRSKCTGMRLLFMVRQLCTQVRFACRETWVSSGHWRTEIGMQV